MSNEMETTDYPAALAEAHTELTRLHADNALLTAAKDAAEAQVVALQNALTAISMYSDQDWTGDGDDEEAVHLALTVKVPAMARKALRRGEAQTGGGE